MIYMTAVHVSEPPSDERIETVRWTNPETNQTGISTVAAVVEWLRACGGVAKVRDEYGEVDVGVVNADPPYLRTYANGKWTDNLLSLPRF